MDSSARVEVCETIRELVYFWPFAAWSQTAKRVPSHATEMPSFPPRKEHSGTHCPHTVTCQPPAQSHANRPFFGQHHCFYMIINSIFGHQSVKRE